MHPKNHVQGAHIEPDENPDGGEASSYLIKQAERGDAIAVFCDWCDGEQTGDLSKHYGTVRWECRECGLCLPLGTY